MKKKSLIFTFIFLMFISGLSIAYAAFTQRDYTHNSTILLGDIKVKYKNNSNSIDLTNLLPESINKGRNHETTSVTIGSKSYDVADNETLFTIKGKNTYRDDLYYRIGLKYGDDIIYSNLGEVSISDFRINDICLKFDLIKIDEDGNEEYLLNNVRYTDLSNAYIYQGIFYHGRNSDINNVFKLRVWISEDTTILATDGYINTGLYISQKALPYMYANFKIVVESDFTNKEVIEPFKYEILEYIKSTNDQYINTGYEITSDEMVMSIFAINEFNSNLASIFGANDNSGHLYGVDIENKTMYSNIYDSSAELVSLNDHNLKLNVLYMSWIEKVATGAVNLNNANETYLVFNTNPPYTLNYGDLYIFKSYESQTNIFKGKLYGFSIWDDSYNIIRDYIPIRNFDDEIGLYELKTNQFFPSLSSNSFVGPEKKSMFIGSGTQNDPYLIRSKNDLNNLFSSISNISNNGNNIAYQDKYFLMTNDITYDGVETLTPLGENKFGGIFDGDGYRIINYKSEGHKLGMFGTLQGGTIKNLELVNATVTEASGTAGTYMGGLVYLNNNGYIMNIIAEVNMVGNGSNKDACGIAGATSTNSYFVNNIVSGTVTNNGSGSKYAVSKSTSSAKAGHYYNVLSTIGSPYSLTRASSLDLLGDRSQEEVTDRLVQSFNQWSMDYNLNCFVFNKSNSTARISHDICDNISLSDLVPLNGSGTQADPYIIGNKKDFTTLTEFVRDNSYDQSHPILENVYFELTNNLVYENGETHEGLANTSAFGGIFDGNGHYLKNLQMVGNGVGLFGSATNATIKNLGIFNGTATHTNSGTANHISTIARRSDNTKVYNVYVIADLNGNNKIKDVEGIMGYVDTAGCVFENGYYFGSLIGATQNRYYPLTFTKSGSYLTVNNFSYNITNKASLTGSSIITHGTERTETYIKSQAMVDSLNAVANAKGYNLWTLDPETGYPIQIPN